MEATTKVHSQEEKTNNFFFFWEDWTKGRCPHAQLRRLLCFWLRHSPPSSVRHLSPCPCLTASWGPYFLLRKARTSLSPPWQDLPRGTQLGRQAAARTTRERCHAQGEIYSSSPLQTLHLAWCRADSSSFPGTADSSSSTGICTGSLGSHTLSCSQGSVPATVLADGRRQPKGSFPKPASFNGAMLWYLLSLYNSVICCQYIFAKETKICLFFLLPQPMKNLSCVQRDSACVCVYMCVLGGGNRVSVNLFSNWKSAL